MGDSAMRQQQLRRRRLLEQSTSDSDESDADGDGRFTYDFEYDRDVKRRGDDEDVSGGGSTGCGPAAATSTDDAERLRLLKTSPPHQDGGDGPSLAGDGDGPERLDDVNATAPLGGLNGDEGGEREGDKSGGGSKIDGYFAQMNEMRRDAWDRLYENTVDGPCQQTCQALVACEQNLEANFKEINCRQLMFFNFPRDPNGGMGGPGVHHPGAGGFPGGHAAAAGPRPCEYCHQMECDDDCDRPELFFLNKKPPFATNHDEWDEDDYPIDKLGENGAGGDGRSIVRNEAGWMSGFF